MKNLVYPYLVSLGLILASQAHAAGSISHEYRLELNIVADIQSASLDFIANYHHRSCLTPADPTNLPTECSPSTDLSHDLLFDPDFGAHENPATLGPVFENGHFRDFPRYTYALSKWNNGFSIGFANRLNRIALTPLDGWLNGYQYRLSTKALPDRGVIYLQTNFDKLRAQILSIDPHNPINEADLELRLYPEASDEFIVQPVGRFQAQEDPQFTELPIEKSLFEQTRHYKICYHTKSDRRSKVRVDHEGNDEFRTVALDVVVCSAKNPFHEQ